MVRTARGFFCMDGCGKCQKPGEHAAQPGKYDGDTGCLVPGTFFGVGMMLNALRQYRDDEKGRRLVTV